MKQEQYKRKDKEMHMAEYFYTTKLVNPLLPALSKTFVTPNMITISNYLFSLAIYYLLFKEMYILAAIGIQLYLFFDILDGNLARYKNMQSRLGAILDITGDRIFYSLLFVFIGYRNVEFYYIALLIILMQGYGIIATYYIVPRLRKLTTVHRTGLKKYFMDKGFIIGMDLGTISVLTSLFLIINEIKLLFFILIIGVLVDISYRLLELKRNERLFKQEGSF